MNERLYEKRFGSYYLIEKVPANPVTNPDGERIITMADQIAIAFDIAMMDDPSGAILLKHGSREFVENWVVEAREKYIASGSEFAQEMAAGLRVIVLPADFPCEEINRCIQNTGYLGTMLKKFLPEALQLNANAVLEQVRAAGFSGQIEFAPTSKLEAYGAELELFSNAIEKLLRPDKARRGLFVSDESYVSHFDSGDHTIYEKLWAELGVPVNRGDSVLDVCKRLRARSLS